MVHKLDGHAQAHAEVIENLKGITLVSYWTEVCGIRFDDEGNRWIWCAGTYSATTRKHIGIFARAHGLSYYDFKQAYIEGYTMCLDTGEVVFN